ncbi:hypothetical protein [Mycobacterium camsae]|uniref:hypothetical protein n=1 Tax=Mycobacterium gordonae TaxID=1778 RepID=UPI00197ECD80|nr:hypothetical protein [Mycobacterium gordonae]
MPNYDSNDEFGALVFDEIEESRSTDYADAESAGLDFDCDNGEDDASIADAFAAFELAEPDGIDLEAIALASQAEVVGQDKEDAENETAQLFTVVNPQDTVSVSALIDGRTQRVELSSSMGRLSESELAEEIVILAELARNKGLAGQRIYLLEDSELAESLRTLGVDGDEVLRDFMETGMGLPTAEQAITAQSQVFASRYFNEG